MSGVIPICNGIGNVPDRRVGRAGLLSAYDRLSDRAEGPTLRVQRTCHISVQHSVLRKRINTRHRMPPRRLGGEVALALHVNRRTAFRGGPYRRVRGTVPATRIACDLMLRVRHSRTADLGWRDPWHHEVVSPPVRRYCRHVHPEQHSNDEVSRLAEVYG